MSRIVGRDQKLNGWKNDGSNNAKQSKKSSALKFIKMNLKKLKYFDLQVNVGNGFLSYQGVQVIYESIYIYKHIFRY